MKYSIRNKLILAICLPLLAVYLTVLVVEYRVGRSRAIAQMQSHLTELAAHHAADLDEELSVVAQVARSAAESCELFSLQSREQIESLLRANIRQNPRVFGSCMAFEPNAFRAGVESFAPYVCRDGEEGKLRSMDIGTGGYNYSGWDWYRVPKQTSGPAWTEPYFDKGAGDILMCTYSAPFRREGRFQGVVTVDISLAHLREEMSRVEIRGGHCSIISRAGTFVSHPDQSRILRESVFGLAHRLDDPDLAEVGRQMMAGERGVRRTMDPDSGEPRWVVFAPVPSVGWSLAAVIPEDEVMADVRARLNRQVCLMLLGLEVIVVVVLLVSAWITRPVARLAEVAQEVARGNLDVQVEGIRGRDEIGQFAGTFNQMVSDLKANLQARIRETATRQAMEKELQVARQIQTSLLPAGQRPFPGREDFVLHAENQPAEYMAGDFFDFWFVAQDVLALVMADVSGKGVPAAMFMAVARTSIRNFSVAGRSPAETLAVVNRAMATENDQQMFVTVFYAHYNVRSGQFMFANAGHNPPLIVRSGGAIESLGPSTGPVLGAWDDASYGDGCAQLDPGDLLLLYTDGVTEAHDPQGRMLQEQGLCEILAGVHTETVEEICRTIVDRVDRFRHHEGQDDVTLLAIRRGARPFARSEGPSAADSAAAALLPA